MAYSVSVAAIVCMWIVIFLCAALIIGPFFYIRKKYKTDVTCFITGAVIFALFAIALETAPKQFFIANMMAGGASNWLIALVAALMAGVFEESGRFFAFQVLLKKKRANDGNALMYGVGHAGCEVVLIVILSMINNLTLASAMNAGTAEALFEGLDEANAMALQVTLGQLAEAKPALFLVSVVERIAAFSAHIALSVVVWAACKGEGKKWLFLVAILLHTFLDFVPGLCSLNDVSIGLIEVLTYVCAAVCVFVAIRVWKAVLKEAPADGLQADA